jgi:hypothetical protein
MWREALAALQAGLVVTVAETDSPVVWFIFETVIFWTRKPGQNFRWKDEDLRMAYFSHAII